MKKILSVLFFITLVSCGTVGEITERQENGKFKASKEAKTVKSIPFNLDSNKTLLVVPSSNFMKGMVKNINYFDKVITFEDYELEIIKAEKQEEVGPLSGRIGLSNAYRKFKPFLYIVFENRDENSSYLQLKLINPDNAKELFVNEILLDYAFSGVTDQNAFNPLFNGLIDYIKSNSNTYK